MSPRSLRAVRDIADGLEIGPLTHEMRQRCRQLADTADLAENPQAGPLREWLWRIGYTFPLTPEFKTHAGVAATLRACLRRVAPSDDGSAMYTEAQAIAYLGLAGDRGRTGQYQLLRRYRQQGLLKATQIGRRLMYSRQELDAFIHRKTEGNR